MSESTATQQQTQEAKHAVPKYESKAKYDTLEEIKDAEKTKLHQKYTIWVNMKQAKHSSDNYESVLKQAASFDTVEDFWGLYQHFRRPTQMTFGTSFNIVTKFVTNLMVQFVDPVKPMWEDENCQDGGSWSLRIPKTHTNKYWEDLVMAMVGEQFSIENEVLGIAIALKPNQDTIRIWNRRGADQAVVEFIKEDIQRFVKIEEGMKLEYENFKEHIQMQKEKEKERKERGDGEDQWRGERGGFRGRGRGTRGRGGYSQYNQ